jgi:hypothetical protein
MTVFGWWFKIVLIEHLYFLGSYVVYVSFRHANKTKT